MDGHNPRRIAGDTDLAEAVNVLASAHQTMIWTGQRHTNQIRSRCATGHRPDPALGRGLSRSKIAAALRRDGRQRRVEERAAEM